MLKITWEIDGQSASVSLPNANATQVIAALRRYAAGHHLATDEVIAEATSKQLAQAVIRHQIADIRRVAVQTATEEEQRVIASAAKSAVGFDAAE